MAASVATYVTAAEADDYVRLLLRPYDQLKVFWDVLSEDEKTAYIIRSTEQIDSLIFTGRKTDCKQELQFPRNGERTVPQFVLKATVYNALGFMNNDIKSAADKQMQLFKSLGVIKNLRLDQTSMRAIATAENAAPEEVKIPLESKSAYALLKPSMCGGFSIR
jgi:hypothetical protein